ncbi:MAG: arrestin family protein, partial [Proteobacteria bacterium]|nr:arrestin family protein [Pseudomonadota bacterium]
LFQHDPRIKIPIQVNGIRDVNLPKFATSVHQSTQKQVGCCCCAGSVEHSADLTRTGFSIGSNIPVTVNVVNGSSRRIKMRASIKKLVTFSAGGETRQERSKLSSVLSDDIAPHSQHSWNVDNLVVPTTEPSFEGSAIIKMQYVVKVTALIPWAKNSSVSIPITIGTVPLSGSNNGLN